MNLMTYLSNSWVECGQGMPPQPVTCGQIDQFARDLFVWKQPIPQFRPTTVRPSFYAFYSLRGMNSGYFCLHIQLAGTDSRHVDEEDWGAVVGARAALWHGRAWRRAWRRVLLKTGRTEATGESGVRRVYGGGWLSCGSWADRAAWHAICSGGRSCV